MPTVLLAEDNEASRNALAQGLELRNYRVLTAVDGLQAVALARASKPDLILMDLGLPGLDGWEATARLKTDGETQHIPIIVLSARAEPNDHHRALAAGGDDFAIKPIELDRLLARMALLLAKHP
ncbi:MAG: response regulator [Acidobacteria bacterium]|nr:response regulator [Acidobacteriota bacterium]